MCERQIKGVLSRHIREVHFGERKAKCLTCEKSFRDTRDLNRHISSVHDRIRNYKCPFCESAFSTKHHLKNHALSKHKASLC